MQAELDSMILGTAGLIHYWPLTEISGSSFSDLKGSNTAVAASDPSRTIGPDGISSAPNFAATTSKVLIPSAVTMPSTHTVAYWMKLNSQGAADAMSFEWATASFAKFVQHDIGSTETIGGTTGKSVFDAEYGVVSGAAATWCNRNLFTTGTWIFVVVTMDQALSTHEVKLYINGIDSSNYSSHTDIDQTQSPGIGTASIGGRGQGGRGLPLDGSIQGVSIFNRLLTTQEMLDFRTATISASVPAGCMAMML